MSRLLLAVAGLLLVSVIRASHLETVFTVALPHFESTVAERSAVVFEDGLYIVCGPDGAAVEAVNLTTRTNLWVSPNLTTYGYIYSIAVTSEAVVLSFGDLIIALSTETGQLLWVQNEYQLQGLATAFSYQSTIYAQVILPTGYYALQSFDLDTGAPGYFQYGNDLQVDGNTAFIAQYSMINEGQIVDSTLRALDIPTNATLWTVPCSDQAPGRLVPAISAQYVAISNLSGGDEIAVVLHRRNGTLVQSFQAFNGFSSDSAASLHGDLLFARVGEQYLRYVLADLATGYIVWTRSLDEVGTGIGLCGRALVSINSSLMLSIERIDTNAPVISVPEVPSLPSPAIVDFGFGLVQIGNLQGYTVWDTHTGAFVGSDELDPYDVLSAPLRWNGLNIVISGAVLTAVKVVP